MARQRKCVMKAKREPTNKDKEREREREIRRLHGRERIQIKLVTIKAKVSLNMYYNSYNQPSYNFKCAVIVLEGKISKASIIGERRHKHTFKHSI